MPSIDFDGGLNQVSPDTEIGDNELSQLVNYEYTSEGRLRTRRGLSNNANRTHGGAVRGLFRGEGHVLQNYYVLANAQIWGSTNLFASWSNVTGVASVPSTQRYVSTQWENNIIFCGTDSSSLYVLPAVGGVSAATAIGGTAPANVRLCVVWNSRLWVVKDQKTIKASALGTYNDFVTGLGTDSSGAIEITPKEVGVSIVDMFVWNRQLWFSDGVSLHTITAGSPNTDAKQLQTYKVLDGFGSIDPLCRTELGSDMIILTKSGLTSLSALLQGADISSATLSKKISFIPVDGGQYWLSHNPATQQLLLSYNRFGSAGDPPDTQYRMSYSQGKIRWSVDTGLMLGTTIYSTDNKSTFVVSGDTLESYVIYDTSESTTDAGTPFSTLLETKRYDFGQIGLKRILWHSFVGNNKGSALAVSHRTIIDGTQTISSRTYPNLYFADQVTILNNVGYTAKFVLATASVAVNFFLNRQHIEYALETVKGGGNASA